MIASQVYRFLSGTAVVALVAGCSGGGGGSLQDGGILSSTRSIARDTIFNDAPVQTAIGGGGAIRSFFSPEAMLPGSAKSFISNAGGEVYILNRELKITATLSGFSYALGLTVDKSHNLYVVDGLASDILVFAPPYNGAPKVLLDPGFQPADVAVDSKGNVAVTNLYTSSGGGPGGIVFYAKGTTSPTKSIPASGNFSGDYFCAFDASDNLFVDSLHGSGPFGVGEVVGGIAGTKVKALTTKNIIQSFGGIEVTNKGRIAILAQGNYPTPPIIYAYNPPHGGSLGTPVASTALSGAVNSVTFALDEPNEAFTLTTNSSSNAGQSKSRRPDQAPFANAYSYRYPAGGEVVASGTLSAPQVLYGVAFNNP